MTDGSDPIHEPVWDAVELPAFPALDRDLHVDVLVIGAGLTGVSTAWRLARAGASVALVDRRRVGGIDTGCTTAHVAAVTDAPLTTLARTLGADHAQGLWDAGLAAIDAIEETCDMLGIACDFARVPGYYHQAFDDEAPTSSAQESFEREASFVRARGFEARAVTSTPIIGRPGVRFDGQARFHPRKYLRGLLGALVQHKGLVFEQSDACIIEGDPPRVSCGGHTIHANHVVCATHNPMMGKQSWLGSTVLQSKLALHTTYAVCASDLGLDVPDALWWDAAEPYRYMRRVDIGRGGAVIVGGEDHKTGQSDDTEAAYGRLEFVVRRLFPDARLTHRWSGQVIETLDGAPIVGEAAPHQWIATGFAGNGMTFGTLASMIISDAIAGRDNPWRALVDPDRSLVAKGPWDYVKENADYPYYALRALIARPEQTSLRAIPRGGGAIVRIGGRPAAVHRKSDGGFVLRSAVCTHMGCMVAWNGAEQTWDCPCHGSRFTPEGEVLSGPAQAALTPIETSPPVTKGAPAPSPPLMTDLPS